MAATVQIVEKNGAGGTATDKTSGAVRFKLADNATVDLVAPLQVPSSGTSYSFEKWLRFSVASGTYTQISNIKAYSDGGNGLGTGVVAYAKAVSTYATPAQAASTTGYASLFGYTSGAALTLGSGNYTGTGEKGDHLVLMCTVASTASAGLTPSETLTWAWDEI